VLDRIFCISIIAFTTSLIEIIPITISFSKTGKCRTLLYSLIPYSTLDYPMDLQSTTSVSMIS
jgi:hypothetical protein